MYLRSTKRKNKDGSTVEYYQLAHNERDPKTRKPVAKIIHNFGRVDKLDRQQLVRLCQSIARVCGVRIVDPFAETPGADVSNGNGFPDDLRIKTTLSFGLPMVIEALWERLDLKKTLEDITAKRGCRIPYEQALFAMVANRLCAPESKLGVWDRWLSKVYIPSCSTSIALKWKRMSFSIPPISSIWMWI